MFLNKAFYTYALSLSLYALFLYNLIIYIYMMWLYLLHVVLWEFHLMQYNSLRNPQYNDIMWDLSNGFIFSMKCKRSPLLHITLNGRKCPKIQIYEDSSLVLSQAESTTCLICHYKHWPLQKLQNGFAIIIL